jgi:hypothetical protein
LKPKCPKNEAHNRRLTNATNSGIHPSTPKSEPEVETAVMDETATSTDETGHRADTSININARDPWNREE